MTQRVWEILLCDFGSTPGPARAASIIEDALATRWPDQVLTHASLPGVRDENFGHGIHGGGANQRASLIPTV